MVENVVLQIDFHARVDSLVVVIHSDRQNPFGVLLANHILVKGIFNFVRLWNLGNFTIGLGALILLGDDVVAQLNALIADVNRGPGDELLHLALALTAKRTQ